MFLRYLVLLLAAGSAAHAQEYAFVKIADDRTPRPDGAGMFVFNGVSAPAMDGSHIVFRTFQFNPSLWSYGLSSGRFTKLADTSTPAPGGTGNFSDFAAFDSGPLVRAGVVVFMAIDSRVQPPGPGIYSVPVTGGPVRLIANYNTVSPGGVRFSAFAEGTRSPFGSISFDGVKVAFTAIGADGNPGVYTANPDGTGLTLVADRNLRIPVSPLFDVRIWQNPAILGNTLALYGQTIQDPSAGFNAIYTAPSAGGAAPNVVFASTTNLPANANINFHTRVRVPTLQMDETSIAFSADDFNTPAPRRLRGLYTVTRAGGSVRRIADITSTLPGIGQLTTNSFDSYSFNGGRILFRAEGPPREGLPSGEQGMFLWQDGNISRVLTAGTRLDGPGGRVLFRIGAISPHAMSGSRAVFLADYGFSGAGVYLAVPVSGTRLAAVQNSASYAANTVVPGGVLTLYGEGLGPQSLETFQLDAANRIPTALAASRFLFNGIAAPLLYTSVNQASVIAPFALDGADSVEIVAQYQDRVSPPLLVPVRAAGPGLFSANRSGSGPGAIANEDGSINTPDNPAAAGSIVVLFGAGFGQTTPPSAEGTITSATNPPRLRTPATVTIGGLPAQVLYQGPAPGAIAGLYQCNVRIPAGAQAGNLPVKVAIGSATSQDDLTLAVSAP